jgi:hypothetical protein
VTESEGKIISFDYDPDPKPAPLVRQQNALNAVTARMLEVEALAAAEPPKPTGRKRKPRKPRKQRELWRGSVVDFALKIEKEYNEGTIQASSLNAAFEWAAEHYTRPHALRFTAHSLRQSLRQRRNKMRGNAR